MEPTHLLIQINFQPKQSHIPFLLTKVYSKTYQGNTY
jgi:hypothetical protein